MTDMTRSTGKSYVRAHTEKVSRNPVMTCHLSCEGSNTTTETGSATAANIARARPSSEGVDGLSDRLCWCGCGQPTPFATKRTRVKITDPVDPIETTVEIGEPLYWADSEK